MSEDRQILEKIAIAAQGCFQQHPAIILGSGASVVHKIRGMGELAQYLLDHVVPAEGAETDAWLLIRTALANDDGLEEALLKTAAPLSLVQKIVGLTWKAIAADDLAVMARAVRGEERFHLSELINGMFKSTHPVVNIVTPEPRRVCRRLQLLSRMEHHEQDNEQVFPRSARARGAAGPRQ